MRPWHGHQGARRPGPRREPARPAPLRHRYPKSPLARPVRRGHHPPRGDDARDTVARVDAAAAAARPRRCRRWRRRAAQCPVRFLPARLRRLPAAARRAAAAELRAGQPAARQPRPRHRPRRRGTDHLPRPRPYPAGICAGPARLCPGRARQPHRLRPAAGAVHRPGNGHAGPGRLHPAAPPARLEQKLRPPRGRDALVPAGLAHRRAPRHPRCQEAVQLAMHWLPLQRTRPAARLPPRAGRGQPRPARHHRARHLGAARQLGSPGQPGPASTPPASQGTTSPPCWPGPAPCTRRPARSG